MHKTFSIGEALSFAWKKIGSNLGVFIPSSLVILLLGVLSNFNQVLISQDELLISISINLFFTVVSLFLSLGFLRISLDAYDNKELKFATLFSQAKVLPVVLGAFIIYTISVIGGFILLIIPGIYVAYRLYFYDIFIVDKKMGVIDSLSASWKVMKGNVLKIFLLLVIVTIINIAGALALVVGLLFTIPIAPLATVYAYKKIIEGEEKDDNQEEKGDEKKEEKKTEEIEEKKEDIPVGQEKEE